MKTPLQKGFSLIELLLVMVVVSALLIMGVRYMEQRVEAERVDKAVLQLQYLLNAGLAYYVANGQWPGTANVVNYYNKSGAGGLQGSFIPNAAMPNPYADFYRTGYYTNNTVPGLPNNNFFAQIDISGSTADRRDIAQIIAGELPLSIVVQAASKTSVYGYVNVPGANLNNAGAVNFAGLYHHGACVPVPSCPDPSMTPQVFVVPVSVSGVNDQGSNNIYPISSFTAFATAMSSSSPDSCFAGDADKGCDDSNPPPSGMHWRVCLQIITERGDVQVTRTDDWGDAVTMAAFTRCEINNEPSGSDFTVFTH